MSYTTMAVGEFLHTNRPIVDRPNSMSAVDCALLLFNASPAQAKNFALAMHERAAWGLDTNLIEHWADVVTELSWLARTPRVVG